MTTLIIKSLLILFFAHLLSLATSSLNVHPAYISSFIFVSALLATYKFCEHRYWLVLPQILFYTIIFPTFILYRIGLSYDVSKTYFGTLSEIWLGLNFSDILINFIPLVATVITLIFINKYLTSSKTIATLGRGKPRPF